jgi:uncharacterized RDD family membrane protein YckC
VTGRRVVATLVDALVLGAFASVVNGDRESGYDLTTLSADSLWVLLGVVMYYVLLEGFTGRTVGKLVTGIRVVDADTGGRPGLLSAVARTALRLVDGLFGYVVGLIIVVNSDRRRRLGDMAAKTLVVRA